MIKRVFSSHTSPPNSPIKPSSTGFASANTSESQGILSPELKPIVSLLSAQSHRRYFEGVFMLLKDLDSEGKPADRQWKEVYGVLTGNQLAIWDSDLLAQLQNRSSSNNDTNSTKSGTSSNNSNNGSNGIGELKPSYINFTDSTFKPMEKLPASSGELNNVIIVSTTLKNRYLIQITSNDLFRKWNAAFRLAAFEYKSLQEAYTASLLSSRGSLLSDIRVILAESKYQHEDWVSVRFGAGMPWKRCYAVIDPPPKKQSKKKDFKPGFVQFFENEKKIKKLSMATITNANAIYAVYPQNFKIIDLSTMIKLEGKVLFKKDEGEKDTSIFLMPEQHSAVPGFDTLIRFIIPLMDSFNLYGRPKRLNADKSDINSLLFALPVLPKVHYLQIEDLMGLVSSPSTLNWSPNDWSRAIKEILKIKIKN
ncbi:unnamed protein product [[Candida] boidinii]|nr:unnamed protein product [[Candida] boidinii]